MRETELGTRIKLAREFRGWTQVRLGEIAGFPARRAGVTVNELERGAVKEPRHSRVASLAEALSVPVEWLYGAGSRAVPTEPRRRRSAA